MLSIQLHSPASSFPKRFKAKHLRPGYVEANRHSDPFVHVRIEHTTAAMTMNEWETSVEPEIGDRRGSRVARQMRKTFGKTNRTKITEHTQTERVSTRARVEDEIY